MMWPEKLGRKSWRYICWRSKLLSSLKSLIILQPRIPVVKVDTFYLVDSMIGNAMSTVIECYYFDAWLGLLLLML